MNVNFPNVNVRQLVDKIGFDDYHVISNMSQTEIENKALPFTIQVDWHCQASGHLSQCEMQHDFEYFMFGGTCTCPAEDIMVATSIIKSEQDRKMLLELKF